VTFKTYPISHLSSDTTQRAIIIIITRQKDFMHPFVQLRPCAPCQISCISLMGFERHAQIYCITNLLQYNKSRSQRPAEVWKHNVMQSVKDECFLCDCSGFQFLPVLCHSLEWFGSICLFKPQGLWDETTVLSVCPSDS